MWGYWVAGRLFVRGPACLEGLLLGQHSGLTVAVDPHRDACCRCINIFALCTLRLSECHSAHRQERTFCIPRCGWLPVASRDVSFHCTPWCLGCSLQMVWLLCSSIYGTELQKRPPGLPRPLTTMSRSLCCPPDRHGRSCLLPAHAEQPQSLRRASSAPPPGPSCTDCIWSAYALAHQALGYKPHVATRTPAMGAPRSQSGAQSRARLHRHRPPGAPPLPRSSRPAAGRPGARTHLLRLHRPRPAPKIPGWHSTTPSTRLPRALASRPSSTQAWRACQMRVQGHTQAGAWRH